MRKTAILYGHPPDYSDVDYKIDATHLCANYLGKLSLDPAEEILSQGYTSLCVAVVYGCINEVIEKFHKWENIDDLHHIYNRYTDGEPVANLASEYGLSMKLFKQLLKNYETEWVTEDPIQAFDSAKPFFEHLDIDPTDALLFAKDVVNGTRQLGITEVDNAHIAMPELRATYASHP